METISTAVIGIGQRGWSNLNLIVNLPNVAVEAVCDIYEDRTRRAADLVTEKTGKAPQATRDYREILANPAIQAVVICTSWKSHIQIAVDAMRAGKAVGMEVGGAASVEECYGLVCAWEETRVPFMFLENCCYGRNEMLVSNIVKAGIFGEIVYCHGAYAHDLREEVSTGKENRHYRLEEYLHHNCENYPTHDLGPIAQILGINRGNRMVSLVSVASKAAGLAAYVRRQGDKLVNKELLEAAFAQGDIVDTLITCENGETISLRLDTTLPRSYSREFTVRGTAGMYEENTHSVFVDGVDEESFEPREFYKRNFDSAVRYEEEYLPECWKSITQEMMDAGHGGMDFFQFKDFFDRLQTGEEMPIDVYDAAAWMCVSCLSGESIARGGMPVAIPDFTNGAYRTR